MCALVGGDLPADVEALAEQPRDLIVELVQAPAEGVEAAHTSTRLMRGPSGMKPLPR